MTLQYYQERKWFVQNFGILRKLGRMKKAIKCSCSIGLVLILCLVVMFGYRYYISKHAQDPLAGWWVDVNHEPNQTIVKDYQDYIHNLSSEERKSVGPIIIFANGTGQHAVEIEIALNGTDWEHILFYDKIDKRTKVMKYKIGKYAS